MDSAGSQPTEAVNQPQAILERFKAAWWTGEKPAIDDFLPSDADERKALLARLIHLELELRLKAGDAARVEDYLARYPEIADDPLIVGDLLVAEFQHRVGLKLTATFCR
jgi:hypothetical protein